MSICSITRLRLMWIGCVMVAVLCASCIVASEADCKSDDDCATGEHCISSGGLFVQDGVCVGDELQNPDAGLPTDTDVPGPPDADADVPGPSDADDAGPPTDAGDTGPSDTAPSDTAPSDTAPSDTAPSDTAPSDTGPSDAGECPGEQVRCEGVCVDTEQDIDHCGGCGQECSTYPSNAVPICTPQGCHHMCQAGYEDCDGQCFDNDFFENNDEHCGECDNSCTEAPSNATPFCDVESCDFLCANGFQRCGETCIPDTEFCCDPNSTAGFGGGSGTANDPYTLCAVEHLDEIDEVHTGDYFRLTSDIDTDGVTSLEPMGHPSQGFSGIFNGGGHSIDNLSIQSSEDKVGAFYALDAEAEIIDLTLSSVNIQGNSKVGAVAGYAEGKLHKIQVDGLVQGDEHVGGVVGAMEGGELTEVSADIDVTAEENNAGGLAGRTDETFIVESSARGNVTSEQGEAVGGLIGKFTGDEAMERVFASGDVEGVDLVGGLIGHQVGEGSHVIDCYATGAVTSSEGYAGGIVGLFSGILERCYSTGEIVDEGHGFIGAATEHLEVISSYLDGDTSNSDNIITFSGSVSYVSTQISTLETAEFEEASNFDFDFDDIWEMDTAPDGHQRPILQWQND